MEQQHGRGRSARIPSPRHGRQAPICKRCGAAVSTAQRRCDSSPEGVAPVPWAADFDRLGIRHGVPRGPAAVGHVRCCAAHRRARRGTRVSDTRQTRSVPLPQRGGRCRVPHDRVREASVCVLGEAADRQAQCRCSACCSIPRDRVSTRQCQVKWHRWNPGQRWRCPSRLP